MLLIKYIDECEKNKITIIRHWISDEKVLNILNLYSINKELFIKRYAFGVLDYHIQLIKTNNEITNSTLILDFLNYLKKHNIKMHELYFLYTQFRTSFIDYLFTIEKPSKELIIETNRLFEQVFANILEDYAKNVEQFKEALSKSTNIVDKNVILSRSDLEGNIIKVSSAFCEITGYESNELIGRPYSILKSNDTPKELYKQMWNTITNGKIWQGEIKNCKKNKDCYWIETTIHPNFDNIGNIINYDVISQDITSKKNLESQQNILIEQSKSAAMGEMISMIAHQWRQPLQAVSILIQKLSITKALEGKIEDDLLEEVVENITSQLDYMSKTIDDFRDYFKPNKKKQKVFINDVINSAVEFLEYMFKLDQIEIEIKTQSTEKLNLFLNEIVQVFINIFKNSRDAMLEKNTKNRKIFISSICDKDNIYIEIEDNAGGIPPQNLHKIFEPYFSTKTNKNGTGLGLYMCKSIIEEHCKGKISAQNTDNGAKFTILLPIE